MTLGREEKIDVLVIPTRAWETWKNGGAQIPDR